MSQRELRLVWVNLGFMEPNRKADGANASQPRLGHEGTLKHWFFYSVAGALVGALLTYAGLEIGNWRASYNQTELSKQIDAAITKSAVPAITESLKKHFDEKFSSLERDKFEPLRKDLSKLSVDFATLQGDVRNLEKGVPVTNYRAQATKLGIQSAKLIPINLNERQKFSDVFFWRQHGFLVQVDYEVIGVKDSNIVMTMQYTMVKDGVEQTSPIKFPFEIPLNFKGVKLFHEFVLPDGRTYSPPPLLMAVVARTSPNDVVLATGLPTDPSKS